MAAPSTVQTQVASPATESPLKSETETFELHGLAEIRHWCRRMELPGVRTKMGRTSGSPLPAPGFSG